MAVEMAHWAQEEKSMNELTNTMESFADLFAESLQTIDMESGSIISGLVVDIDSEWVTVHGN